MRLKKIPKGTKMIKFTNPYKINAIIYVKKSIWHLVGANEYTIMRADNFFGDGRVYPEMQLYSNLKIQVEYE